MYRWGHLSQNLSPLKASSNTKSILQQFEFQQAAMLVATGH